MTYEEALGNARELLKNAGIEEYASDAFILTSEILGIPRNRYLIDKDNDIPGEAYDTLRAALARRIENEPVQYIIGHTFFYGYEFRVTPDVLIPRMDTECLVEKVLGILKKEYAAAENIKVLDMCTGSGCILTAILMEDRRSSGIGADISAAALKVADDNIKRITGNDGRARLIESDLFSNINEKFDLIVSNPPYIRPEVIETLDAAVREHEPYIALCGHDDGLFFYENITANAEKYLNDGGYLCYEIGYDQKEAVLAIMQRYGFSDCACVKDLAGLDRVVVGHI